MCQAFQSFLPTQKPFCSSGSSSVGSSISTYFMFWVGLPTIGAALILRQAWSVTVLLGVIISSC